MTQLDPELKQAVQNHPSDDIVKVSKDVSRQLDRHVPVTLIAKIRGSLQRNVDVNQAREVAAGSLQQKLGRIEGASESLEGIFHDESLPLKDRIEASKELRQWTKLGMDAAGIHDAESETLWVVEGEWDMTPPKR